MIGAHGKSSARGWVLIAVRWAAALAVLGALLHFIPWSQFSASIARVPATRFIAILMGYLLAHCVGAAKWRMVVNAAGARLNYATAMQCYAGGLFGTLFLPSIIGGDVVRLAVGLRRSPNPAGVLAGNAADRFLDVCAQGGLVVVGLLLLPGSLPAEFAAAARKGLLVVGAVAVVVVVAGVALYRPLMRGRSRRFLRRVARLRNALRAVSQRPHVLALGWAMGTAVQFSFLFLTAVLAASCGLLLPLRVWMFGWPLAKLAAVLPLTQGGIGVREAALVGLLVPFGAPGPLVLASGLAWEAVVIAGGLVAGGVSLLLGRGESKPSAS